MIREILHYQTVTGKDLFSEWLDGLLDFKTINRIEARLDQLEAGNFGDVKLVATGVWELRFHFGPGYRVYFGLDGQALVILLCGGDKSTQERDIKIARECWVDYLRRTR
ncbi:MAG: addiction module killer protein [Omnitrophica bacterium RIFOXYB12_FULL_50_7]|nr:MAG: addiction module killer protein [Omnitrophica bacterium RIFOXYB12_FULL_50_7]